MMTRTIPSHLPERLVHVAAAAAIWFLGVGAVALAAPTYEVYLTSEEVEGTPVGGPAQEFTCSDKIFAVIEIDDPERRGELSDEQLLEATWRDPI